MYKDLESHIIHKHIIVQVQANASSYKYVFKFLLKVSKEFESFTDSGTLFYSFGAAT